MNNYTHIDQTDNGTTFLGGLSEVEIVVIGTVTAVLLLGLIAIILRITMPRIKQRRKEKMMKKKQIVDEKNGKLLAPGTPLSQASRASSKASALDDWSDNASDHTKMTNFSQTSLLSKDRGLYSNFRLQPAAQPGMSVSTDRINEDLISVISHRSVDPLEPLNLASTYRDNWDQQFSDVTRSASTDGLCYLAHPSENPELVNENYLTVPHMSRSHHVSRYSNQPFTRL